MKKNISNETSSKIFELFRQAESLAGNEGFTLNAVTREFSGSITISAKTFDQKYGCDDYRVERSSDEWLPHPTNPSLGAKTVSIFK